MKLIVTGGSGYLGAAILRRADPSWSIAATYLTHPSSRRNAAAFRVDVCKAEAMDALFAAFQPDVVIHTAARMSGDAMMATNVDGSRHTARAAARTGARLIHMSSDVIFDGEHAPYDESALPHPITPYGDSKARAERAVVEENPTAVIIRTSLIYGFSPLDPRTRQTLAGEMPRLFTDEYRCPIFVHDLADALVELAQSEYVGVLNIAGPQRVSRFEFGNRLTNALGVPPRFEPALCGSHREPRPRDCTLDTARARLVLHARLRSVDEVLSQI